MPDILLYGPIDAYSSSDFINNIIAADSQDITVRVNSPGGEVQYGWGCVAKFSELTGKKTLKNDGKAYSMGAYMFCYAEDSEATDVSDFIIHRAAYPEWLENDPDLFNEQAQASLAKMNAKLRTALENKVDVVKFEEITGVKIKDIFSMDGRIDVNLSASDAKKVGLINRVVTITPKKKAEIEAYMYQATAKQSDKKQIEKPKIKNMNIETLKAEHPNVFAEILALGVSQEQDRVNACLVFMDADPKGVKEAISNGKPLSATQMAEFTMAAVNKATLSKMQTENAGDITVKAIADDKKTDVEKTKEAEISAFETSLDKQLGLNKK